MKNCMTMTELSCKWPWQKNGFLGPGIKRNNTWFITKGKRIKTKNHLVVFSNSKNKWTSLPVVFAFHRWEKPSPIAVSLSHACHRRDFQIIGFTARICKRLRRPGIDSEDSIPPAYVGWRAGIRQIGLSFRPIRLGIDYKFTNTGSGFRFQVSGFRLLVFGRPRVCWSLRELIYIEGPLT